MSNANGSEVKRIRDTIFSLPFAIGLLLVSSLVFIYISSRGDEGGISNIDYARGLITLFFAVGTIAIALMLTISALFQTGEEAKDRFDRGREILGLLIGIFGTIVGFYFGSANSNSALAVNNPPSIAAISPEVISAGKNEPTVITITTANRTKETALSALISNEVIDLKSIKTNLFQFEVSKEMTKEAGILSIQLFDEANGQLSSPVTVEIK